MTSTTRRLPGRSLIARLSRRTGDEGGFALIFTTLLILIVGGVLLSMAALVISQVKPTQFARKNIRTVNAAAAGLQVSLTRLRSANDGAGNGVLTSVPCTSSSGATFSWGGSSVNVPGSTFTGPVDGQPGNITYTTSVTYLDQNPSPQEPGGQVGNSAQQFLTWLQGNALGCPLSHVPAYAYLQSGGQGSAVPGSTASSGDRTQRAVYQFAMSNVNVAGGRILEYGTTNPGLCMEAASSTPGPGTQIVMKNCQALGYAQQTWQYRSDLTIFYGGNPSLNLCIEKPTSGSTPTLQTCTGNGSGQTYPYLSAQQQRQEWGFNDNGHFSAALSDGTVTNSTGGSCLEPTGATSSSPATAGALLTVTSCDSATTGYTAWNPDPQVGAGKAGGNITGVPGTPTNQYVNYKEFGRCLDVTGQNVNADHLIDYPCKQAPNSSTLTWNQVWTFNSAVSTGGFGNMYVTYSNTRYCLTAPSGTSVYIVVSPCQSPAINTQLWKATGNAAGNYAGSYLLQSKSSLDSSGGYQCMTASPTGAITYGSSNIIVAPCDGSLGQKWNAPPNSPQTGLSDIQEGFSVTGG